MPAISPTGSYSVRQYDRVRGFRLLVHAEIEAYLEDRVTELAATAFTNWQADEKPRSCLFALVAYHEGGFPRVPASVLSPAQNPSLDLLHARLKKAKDIFVQKAKTENHGIREANILALVFPVGVQLSELNQTWLATIDSFGRERGKTAHTAGRTQQPPDPATEVQIVRQILAGLKDLDAVLSRLLSE